MAASLSIPFAVLFFLTGFISATVFWLGADVPPTVLSTHREPLPMRSLSAGFHPVHVYSKATQQTEQSYSQVGQDRITIALLEANNAKNTSTTTTNTTNTQPFFVDLAANNAISLSNTYLLESRGWNGLCIEPNPQYWYLLASLRRCTIVGTFVGGTADGVEIDVSLSNGAFGGIIGAGFDNKPKRNRKVEKRNLVSLKTLFDVTNVPEVIDYFSLDVEGAESLVMKDFPWMYYNIKIMTVERPKTDLKDILRSQGFDQVAKLSTFGETLWINKASILLSQVEIDTVITSAGAKNYDNKK